MLIFNKLEAHAVERVAAKSDWLGFYRDFVRNLPDECYHTVSYELFNYFRDSGPFLWFKDPLKAVYHSWLSNRGHRIDEIPTGSKFDYCFVICGTGIPGLSTSYPLLRALPLGVRTLLVVRDYVMSDRRIAELRSSSAIEIINVDRIKVRWRFAGLLRDLFRVFRHYPSAWLTIPQLALRRIRYEYVVTELLARVSVSNIVVTNERLMLPSIAIRDARQAGVHSVCLQHGALVDQYLPVTVDTYFTWGEYASSWLRERTSDIRVYATGAPRVDRVVDHLIPAAKPANPNAGAKIVAFFTQPESMDVPVAYHKQVATQFLLLARNPSLVVWIKLHPSDRRMRWEKLAGQAADRIRFLESQHDTYQVIHDADYIGAFYSTVLLEAMLFAKPVFQLNPFGDHVPDYSRHSGCTRVEGGNELERWILQCETDTKFRNDLLARQAVFAKSYFSNVGGAAAACFTTFDRIACESREREFEAKVS